jgi:hypothetical protein
MTRQIFRMGYQGFKCGSPHRDVSDACVARHKSSQRPFLMHKVRPTRVTDTFLTDMCEVDWASLDDLQDETITTVVKVMFVTNELRWRGSEGANRSRT